MDFKKFKKKLRPVIQKISPYTETAERVVDFALKMSKPSLTGYIGVASAAFNNLQNYLDTSENISSHAVMLIFPEDFVLQVVRSWGIDPHVETVENVQRAKFRHGEISVTISKSIMKLEQEGNMTNEAFKFLEKLRSSLYDVLPNVMRISPMETEQNGYEMAEIELSPYDSKQGAEIVRLTSAIMGDNLNARRVVLFTGRPGVGKTTKAQEVARRIKIGRRTVILSGSLFSGGKMSMSSLKRSLDLMSVDVLIVDDIDKLNMSVLEVELLRQSSRLVIFTANNGSHDEVLDGAVIRPDRIDEVFQIEPEEVKRDHPFDLLGDDVWDEVRDWPIAYLNEVSFRLRSRSIDDLRIDDLRNRLTRRTRSGSHMFHDRDQSPKRYDPTGVDDFEDYKDSSDEFLDND